MRFISFVIAFITLCFIYNFSACAEESTTPEVNQTPESTAVAERAVSSNYIYNEESTYDSRKMQQEAEDMNQGPVRKFGRGLCNTIFGVFEIPIQIYKTDETSGGLAAWTLGLTNGCIKFLEREGVGIIDIITFPMPLPGASTQKYGKGWGYGPLMEPEWIFSFETNPYDFVYRNRPPN